MSRNVLYYGDNLDILRRSIHDESVDLIYLDPPFNSNASYNVLFAEQDGARSAAQIKAFGDTWRWDELAVRAYQDAVEAGGPAAKALKAMRDLLGNNSMTAYLSMMTPRLVELHRVLKPTGTLYLHCDPTASHYLKIMLDAIFGPTCFGNEIIWAYKYGGRSKSHFGKKHDVILRYTRTQSFTFNSDNPNVRIPHETDSLALNYRHLDEDGRRYREGTWKSGKKYRYYADEGRLRDDVWADIGALHQADKERLGYPTQKPLALLDLIIQASSNPGDVILDPFCGCGTTIDSAQRLDRRWIGIDITHLAIGLIKHRLKDAHGDVNYETRGEPTTVEDARAVAQWDRYQFEAWALGLVGARIDEKKKGADAGIDGVMFFHDGSPQTRQAVFQVKSGHLTLSAVRDFGRVIEREEADIGVLLTLEQPTPKMRAEAASLGTYKSIWGRHPRYQILTVEELLGGGKVDMPPVGQANQTFKRAERYKPPVHQPTLLDEE